MLISETDCLELHYHPGCGDTLLITFSPKLFKTNGINFWGEHPVKKLRIPCLAFTDKTPAWYPAADMASLLPIASSYLRKYSRIIAYGFSMGAYAALKYSKMLNVTHVLSLSPQFSINPNDTPTDRRYIQYYNESIHSHMKLQKSDISGTPFIVYDPWLAEDLENVNLIAQIYPGIQKIPAHMVGHATINLFNRTTSINSVIKKIINNDLKEIKNMTRSFIRNNKETRIHAAIHINIRNNTKRAYKILETYGNLLKYEDILSYKIRISERFLRINDLRSAARNALDAIYLDPGNARCLELLSDILFSEQQDKAGLIWLHRALDADAKRSSAHERLARYRARTGDLDGAIDAASAAVAHSAEDPAMMYLMSDLLLKKGDLEMSGSWAIRAARKAPSTFLLQLHAARVLARRGEGDAASEFLRRADAAAGPDPHRARTLAHLRTEIEGSQ